MTRKPATRPDTTTVAVDRRRQPPSDPERVDDAIRFHVEKLAALVDRARGRSVDDTVLRNRVGLFQRLEGLATVGLADTIQALASTGAVGDDGASSTAQWVEANTGRSGRDAARMARLAIDLPDLPNTRAALAAGDITDESADAVTLAARDGRIGGPVEVDAELVDVARSSSPEALRADIRDRQQAADGAAMLRDENRTHSLRDVRLWRKDTGMWRLAGDLPDELGQSLRTMLDAFDHPDPPDTLPTQCRRPGQRLADALAAATAAVLDGGLAPGAGGITRPHLSIIVHADTASADLADPSATDPDDPSAAPAIDDPRWTRLPGGDLPWGGKLSPQAVRRICCDAAVTRIVMAGASQVLDVGRATRTWSGPQRRALNARDRGCRGPNCSRPIAWTSIHHLTWWSNDGTTSVDNGLALCHSCHRLVHDHDWTVGHDLATSTATWTSRTGTVITTHPGRRGTDRGVVAGPPGANPPADAVADGSRAGPGRPPRLFTTPTTSGTAGGNPRG